MRQRRAVLVGTGLALVGVLVTATMALGTGKHEITTPITIKVEAIGGHAAFLQLNPNKHTSFGDQFVISAPLTSPGGAQMGRLHADCTFFDKPGIVAECTGTFLLRGGQVVARGPVDFGVKNQTSGSILGGSGRYRNARGQVTFINSTGNTEGFILELEP